MPHSSHFAFIHCTDHSSQTIMGQVWYCFVVHLCESSTLLQQFKSEHLDWNSQRNPSMWIFCLNLREGSRVGKWYYSFALKNINPKAKTGATKIWRTVYYCFHGIINTSWKYIKSIFACIIYEGVVHAMAGSASPRKLLQLYIPSPKPELCFWKFCLWCSEISCNTV